MSVSLGLFSLLWLKDWLQRVVWMQQEDTMEIE